MYVPASEALHSFTMPDTDTKPLRLLSLDGGGAKGFYTLGVLAELEAMLGGGPLANQFPLIFGDKHRLYHRDALGARSIRGRHPATCMKQRCHVS